MKRNLWMCILAMTVTCFCGCIVQSLHPFYTAKAVIESPVENGEWTMLDKTGKPEMPRPWKFENDKITVCDEHGASGILKVVYFKVGDKIFMDAIADEPGEGVCSWWALHLTPVHTVCQVEIQDHHLTLTPIDYEWIEKALKDKTAKIPHLERNEQDFLVFTASSEEWMAFLKTHIDDNKVFSKTGALKFVRKHKKSADESEKRINKKTDKK